MSEDPIQPVKTLEATVKVSRSSPSFISSTFELWFRNKQGEAVQAAFSDI